MPLVNTAVPNLLQGVSQQSDITRFDGQCSEQENAISSVVEGLAKRPHMALVEKALTSAIVNDSFVHFINQAENERFAFIHDGSNMRAYNLITGAECTINNSFIQDNSSTKSQAVGNYSYLNQSNPLKNLQALTVGSTTFLLNKQQTVGQETTTAPAREKNALFFVKQGDYNKKYEVDINSTGTAASGQTAVNPTNFTFTFAVSSYTQDTILQGSRVVVVYHYELQSVNFDGGTGFDLDDSVVCSLSTSATGVNHATNPEITFTSNSNGQLVGTVTEAGDLYVNGDSEVSVTVAQNIALAKFAAVAPSNITLTPSAPSFVSVPGTADSQIKFSHQTQKSNQESDDGATRIVDTSKILTALLTDGQATATTGSPGDLDNNFTVTKSGHVGHLEGKDSAYPDGVDFKITTSDGLAGGGVVSVYKQTATITDLPAFSVNGFQVKVSGDKAQDADDYYVKFETADGASFGNGSYVETIAPGVKTKLKASTMPHKLVYQGGDVFVLKENVYEDRLVGDNISNPFPSFVNSNINGIFFFKDRLGFLAQDKVIMSEAGLGIVEGGETKFNFFRTTVQTILDSDPIDVTIASGTVTNLHAAIGFQENLVLFSNASQFVLKGGDSLTPNNISVVPVTNFEVSQQVNPQPLGSYIYFPFKRGNFTGVREFTVNATTDNYDAEEITEHVPTYVPKNLIKLVGSTTEDIIVGLSSDTANTLYIYKYLYTGAKKIQGAWSKFIFPFDIRGFDIFDGILYAVTTKESETHLVTMNLQSNIKDAVGFNTYLDMRKEYSMTGASQILTLPYKASTVNEVKAYTQNGTLLPSAISQGSNLLAIASGGSNGLKIWVGIPYTTKYVFSEQVLKLAKQPTDSSNKVQIRNFSVFFDNAKTFTVKVTSPGRTEATNTFTAALPNATTVGDIQLADGAFRCPVYADANDTEITLENDGPFPSSFQSAEFEQFVSPRSKRLS